jgi:hypothetical protein
MSRIKRSQIRKLCGLRRPHSNQKRTGSTTVSNMIHVYSGIETGAGTVLRGGGGIRVEDKRSRRSHRRSCSGITVENEDRATVRRHRVHRRDSGCASVRLRKPPTHKAVRTDRDRFCETNPSFSLPIAAPLKPPLKGSKDERTPGLVVARSRISSISVAAR